MRLKFVNYFLVLMLGLCVYSCKKDNSVSNNGANPCPSKNLVLLDLGAIKLDNIYIVQLVENAYNLNAKDNYDTHQAFAKSALGGILNGLSLGEYEIGAVYTEVFNGFAIKIDEAGLTKLRTSPLVKAIEAAKPYGIIGDCDPAPVKPQPTFVGVSTQQIPYGVQRVGRGNGTGKKVWIIDSGVNVKHPDLKVNINLSRNFTSGGILGLGNGDSNVEDEVGHGTHVAGIIGALDNTYGVVGVAAGAEIISVRVFGAEGNGSSITVMQGVDYVAGNALPGEVCNMSLGGGYSELLNQAVQNAALKGIYFAIAAGNDSDDAADYSPASAQGARIFTVSAMDANDNFASYSNYGNPPIKACEPGSNVYSTFKNGTYQFVSGTSMAAPHMAGMLMLVGGNVKIGGYVKGDKDGKPDPIGVIK